LAQLQPTILVHPEQIHSGSSNSRQARDFAAAIGKMVVPIIESWMKQPGQLFGSGINSRKICSFVQIAVMASQRQIIRNVLAAVLTRNDMFDVKLQGLVLLLL
jgi:hypothetical protein